MKKATASSNYTEATFVELLGLATREQDSSLLPASSSVAELGLSELGLSGLKIDQHSRFMREGDNLVIRNGADLSADLSSAAVVIEGYFTMSPPPSLPLAGGGYLSPALVASFLEGGTIGNGEKYALGYLSEQWDNFFGEEDIIGPIGLVERLEGLVQITRDGSVIDIEKGAEILIDDIISTGEGAEVFLRFDDQMNFHLGENGRLQITEFIYNEINSEGLQVLSIISGAFSYVSGLVAGANPASVRLDTPYGTIGIRGTKILGKVDLEANELTVTVLSGRVILSQDDEEVADISKPYETLRVKHDDAGEQVITIKTDTIEEILGNYDFLDAQEEQLEEIRTSDPLAYDDAADLVGASEGVFDPSADGAVEDKSEPTTAKLDPPPVEPVQIEGGAGNDKIPGGLGNDLLSGGAGNDEIEGKSGNDIINGDAGNDKLWGGAGNDALNGDEGDDWLYGGEGNDEYDFYVGDGNDVIIDSSGVNELFFRSYSKVGSYVALTADDFSKKGDDLEIAISTSGVSQKVTIEDYYSSGSHFSIYYNTEDGGQYTQVSLDLLPQ